MKTSHGICGLMAALLVAGCTPPPAVQPPEPPVVTVEHPIERTLDQFAEFTGYLKSVESLEIRAQVTGYLKEIRFTEGGLVKPGDVLYEIDPEPYEASLANAQASVAKAKADVTMSEATRERARADYDRAAKLQKDRAISSEEFDLKKAARDSAEASIASTVAAVAIAEANLKKAEFDRKNCTIRSDAKSIGRASRTTITKGNLVVSGMTVLCKITSVDPIEAMWDVDEATSLNYRRMIFDTKELADPRKQSLKCWIGTKDETGYPHAGEVNYIAPEIVRGTGTREIRGVIANPDYRLSPGDSVRVKVESGAAKTYLTVPEIAITSQQGQKFVYAIGKDAEGKSVVEMRPVNVGMAQQMPNGIRIVTLDLGANPETANIKPTDLIVVNGLMRVRPGAVVAPKEQPPLAGPASAAK